MDLNEIAVFAQVVKAGSFTNAARVLKMPKSTVSRKVSELEERLGARLLQRSTRTLNLTDAGRAFYPYAARIVEEADAAESAISRMQATPQGLLRVTVPLSFSSLGSFVATFLAQFPDVEVEMVATDHVVDLIEEGYDLGLRAGVLTDSTLIVRKLGMLRSYVVASPKYLEKHGEPQQPSELVGHACLSFGSSPDPGNWTLENASRRETISIQTRLVANDFDILQEAVTAGLGVALLPAARCIRAFERDQLCRVLKDWRTPAVPIQAVYPSGRHLSPKVTAFVAHLRSDPLLKLGA